VIFTLSNLFGIVYVITLIGVYFLVKNIVNIKWFEEVAKQQNKGFNLYTSKSYRNENGDGDKYVGS
jgi:hypothetical protein